MALSETAEGRGLIKDRQKTMPQPSRNEYPSKKASAEVISPLSIQGSHRGQDRLRPERRRLRNVALLGLVLIAVVALGGWLLHYLTSHPIVAVPDTPPPVADDKSITVLRDSIKPAPISPAVSEPATQAMEKTQTEAVKRLVESAAAHESDRNDALALTDYQRALALDPEAERAIAGRSRVKARLAEAQFERLMSAGLAALAQNDLQTARSRLLEARAVRPDDPGVVDALAQTDQAIWLNRIENLRQTAIRAEQSEDWEQALASYQNVLELDGNIRFAVQGTARAQDSIRINKRIRFFLENPAALESDRQLQNALSLLDETGGFEATGPRLNARIKQLRALVEAAQTPVRLTIESDNVTEVAVYKVGKFGRFTVHEVFLRPGTYTVVGSREGYQDVRKTLKVESGQQSQRISVICKVKV